MQKNVSKKCKLLIIYLLLCAQLFAYSGSLSGESKLKVTKTKWFDLIYPERCQESAAILFEKADTVYDEVTAQYGLEPAFRMPVVITPVVEQFNAFWTAVPYNHIEIYDTGAGGAGDLAVFSETLLSTFRHELTHAVTYNMKNGFWRGLGKVMGDCVAPGMLSVTTGMAEGATLASESAAGEGRLNDEYAKHYVKQAKIEDQFPAYHDVSGSADIQPSGAPYYFNGAFHGWLQEKYGLEAYANFWYRVVNGKNFTIAGAFKKSFGIKLKKAWQNFVEEYELPSEALEAPNPVSAGLVQDFFDPESKDYSIKNNAGSVYSSLTVSADGSRLLWMDRYGGRVFEAPSNRRLFSQRGLTDIRLSNDGRFVAASYISGNGRGDTARVKIYDYNTKSFFTVKEKGLKEALVVQGGYSWYLVAQKYFDQHYSISISKLKFGVDRRICATEPVTQILLEAESHPFAFTALDDGSFAWIKRRHFQYSLCINAVDGSAIREIDFPEGMVVHSLAYTAGAAGPADAKLFYFSYAEEGTLPRLGSLELDAEGGRLGLSTRDISGGVFEPVFWNGKVVYIGEFLRQSRILCMEDQAGGAGGRGLAYESLEDGEAGYEPENSSELTHKTELPAKNYNPFPYLVRGILIPLSNYSTYAFNYEPKPAETSVFDNFYPGITYITANPWTDGSADLFTLTGGYNPITNTFGTSLSITKGTATPIFSSTSQIKSEFNKDGWKQGGLTVDLSSTIEVGRVSSIVISNSASAYVNRKEVFSITDIASLAFSTIRKAGPGRWEKAGFSLTATYGRWYEATIKNPKNDLVESSALAAGAKICLPHLLPFESIYGFTYNLPFTANFKLLPSSSIYGYASFGEDVKDKELKLSQKALGRVIFDATAEVTLFSMEIQKAIPVFTAFYLNDFYVNGGYAATGTAGSATEDGFQTKFLGEYFKALGDGRGSYLDSVYARAGLEFTPNIGVFAKPNFKMGVYAIYSYTLHTAAKKELKPAERTKITLGLNANF